jgi:hypothetical protein
MVNYENCVNSQKSKHSTVPHWTSGNSALFKRLISNTKSFPIVISKWVKCFNLIGFSQSSRRTGMTQLLLRSWSPTSFNPKDRMIAWSASYWHHWLETKWSVDNRKGFRIWNETFEKSTVTRGPMRNCCMFAFLWINSIFVIYHSLLFQNFTFL